MKTVWRIPDTCTSVCYNVGRTLLVGHPGVTWRDWLKEHRGNRDLIWLDPSEGLAGPPARLVLLKANKIVQQRFYGSLDPLRAPHVYIASLARFLEAASEDCLVHMFAYRPSPLLRQIVTLAAQLIQPSDILVGEGISMDLDGLPVGPERVELSKSFPPLVQQAQRKAHWMKMLEECEDHEVDLRQVSFEGSRLGSGDNVTASCEISAAFHAERCGTTLLIVASENIEEQEIARALDLTQTQRAHLTDPSLYHGLLCGFTRANGEDFGMGVVESVDWASMRALVRCTAIPPAPVRILRLGSLRLDALANEVGELKPWQV